MAGFEPRSSCARSKRSPKCSTTTGSFLQINKLLFTAEKTKIKNGIPIKIVAHYWPEKKGLRSSMGRVQCDQMFK